MGGKKKTKKCRSNKVTSEDDFVQEALHAKLPPSVYMYPKPEKYTKEFKLPNDSFTRKLHRDIDAAGSDVLISGTNIEELGFNKSDWKDVGGLKIPDYNGQMENKDFSLTDPDSRSEDGRSPED